MAKWYGMIGYAETVETTPGNWDEQLTERPYYGDVIRNTRKLQGAEKVNDDISIATEISVVAKWKVSNVEVQYPRLILTIGGVYNAGQTA